MTHNKEARRFRYSSLASAFAETGMTLSYEVFRAKDAPFRHKTAIDRKKIGFFRRKIASFLKKIAIDRNKTASFLTKIGFFLKKHAIDRTRNGSFLKKIAID